MSVTEDFMDKYLPKTDLDMENLDVQVFIDGLRRELQKILDVVQMADVHFISEGAMNAALHMTTNVRPTPLAAAMSGARAELERLVQELQNGEDRI